MEFLTPIAQSVSGLRVNSISDYKFNFEYSQYFDATDLIITQLQISGIQHMILNGSTMTAWMPLFLKTQVLGIHIIQTLRIN